MTLDPLKSKEESRRAGLRGGLKENCQRTTAGQRWMSPFPSLEAAEESHVLKGGPGGSSEMGGSAEWPPRC